MEEGREFQIVARIWNELEPKDRLVQETCILAEEGDRDVRNSSRMKIIRRI